MFTYLVEMVNIENLRFQNFYPKASGWEINVMDYKEIIKKAREENRKILSEYESKEILKEFGIPILNEYFVKNTEELQSISHNLSFPVVLKGISRIIAHKTERNLVRLFIKSEEELKSEFVDVMKVEGVDGALIAPQIMDKREFLLGLREDKQFGYVVLFGLGGVFTEVIKDISMRICPITRQDALEMITEVRSSKLLSEIRGYKEICKDKIIDCLIALSTLSEKISDISEIDINPIMFSGGNPVAVDALIVLKDN